MKIPFPFHFSVSIIIIILIKIKQYFQYFFIQFTIITNNLLIIRVSFIKVNLKKMMYFLGIHYGNY